MFPILIVAAGAHLAPHAVLDMAVLDPARYAKTLAGIHYLIEAGGGAFLLLLALTFFLDPNKDSHWLGPIERAMKSSGSLTLPEAAITVGVLLLIGGVFVPAPMNGGYVCAGMVGILAFCATKSLAQLFAGIDEKIVGASIGSFLYLEALDASFSFDGVAGAFALSNNILLIMAGLGIGALTVRELTLLMVNRHALTTLPYLEHGAFWSILVLAVIMLVGPAYELPDLIKGLCGAAFIAAALITSVIVNRRRLAAPRTA